MIKTTTEEKSNSNSTTKIDTISKNIQLNPNAKINHNPVKRQYKIIKRVEDVKFKLKRGKDTPGIHIRTLFNYMN